MITAATGGSTNGIAVRVAGSFAGMPAMRQQWLRLFTTRPNEPSTSYEWTAAMIRYHLRADDRTFLISLEKQGELVGVMPLICRKFKLFGNQVALLMPLAEEYNTHSDFMLASCDDDVADALVATLFTLDVKWDCFRMARLLEENPLVPALRRALRARQHRHQVRPGLGAYVLDLPATFDAYLSQRSAKFRNHLKRMERKLAEAGAVEDRVLSSGDDFDAAFDALLQVEGSSWKHSFGTSITAVPRQTAFYHDFAHAALGTGRLHLHWLSVGGKAVAYNLGYLTDAGYHYLKTSYDAGYRELGPAAVLRARLIARLIAAGVARMDFPGEPYEWEAQWTSTIRSRVVLSVYPDTVRGRLLSSVDRIKHWRSGASVRHVDPRAGRRGPLTAAAGA
jgi:CelD/BcsL family acetyltransferase involved in cellulose biosynthesis